MKPESELLKYIAKEVVHGGHEKNIIKLLRSPQLNWQRLKYLLSYHEMMPFLFRIIRNSAVSKDFYVSLKNTYYQQLAFYMRLHSEFIFLLKEAHKQNLRIIPIKGFSYPEVYYSKFGFRNSRDIDILIEKSDFEKGVALLERLGYKKYLLGAKEDYWMKKQYHLEFIKIEDATEIISELHWALDYERNGREILPVVWDRLRMISFEGNEVYVMSPEDTLISLALHQRRFGNILSLKYVCDIGIILEKETIDWDYIVRSACQYSFRASLFFILAQVQIVLEEDLKNPLNKLKIPFWQRKFIFTLIKKYTYASEKDFSLNYLYLVCHLLLYDNPAEAISYIFSIPLEQFAKFYKLPLYAEKTKLRYKIRFVYIFYKLIKDNLGKKLTHK